MKITNTVLESPVAFMEPPYQELFNDLLKRICQYLQAELPEAERFQNCFWASLNCYQKLKTLVLQSGFANENDEINFFRNVKPTFTCFIEFFVTASEALWFVENKAGCAAIFWKEEIEKYSRFCKKYYSFIEYFDSGDQEYDHEYFRMEAPDAIGDIHSKVFDEDPALKSAKDWMVRSYFAHAMYYRFAREKLASLIPVS